MTATWGRGGRQQVQRFDHSMMMMFTCTCSCCNNVSLSLFLAIDGYSAVCCDCRCRRVKALELDLTLFLVIFSQLPVFHSHTRSTHTLSHRSTRGEQFFGTCDLSRLLFGGNVVVTVCVLLLRINNVRQIYYY